MRIDAGFGRGREPGKGREEVRSTTGKKEEGILRHFSIIFAARRWISIDRDTNHRIWGRARHRILPRGILRQEFGNSGKINRRRRRVILTQTRSSCAFKQIGGTRKICFTSSMAVSVLPDDARQMMETRQHNRTTTLLTQKHGATLCCCCCWHNHKSLSAAANFHHHYCRSMEHSNHLGWHRRASFLLFAVWLLGLNWPLSALPPAFIGNSCQQG